jgi:hypothetical protein
MRTLALSSLLLVSGILGLAQDSTDLSDKAPAPIEEALRARVDQFYHAFVVGKYKDAYVLVADESQDAFLQAEKVPYKACETGKIRYSDNFTKALVVETCGSELKWHGLVTTQTYPVNSTWKIEDGKWVWVYVKPTQMRFPFSPTGFVQLPQAESPGKTAEKKDAPVLPADLRSIANNILAKVSLDKLTVHLRSDQSSRDVIRVRNEMPGAITLSVDQFGVAGLKVTVGKTQLQANEETTILFEWRLDDPAILCPNCTKTLIGSTTIKVHVAPTAQVFPINVTFERAPETDHPIQPQVSAPPQK